MFSKCWGKKFEGGPRKISWGNGSVCVAKKPIDRGDGLRSGTVDRCRPRTKSWIVTFARCDRENANGRFELEVELNDTVDSCLVHVAFASGCGVENLAPK